MATTTVTFSRIASEPFQEAGTKKSRVISLTFQVSAGEQTIVLTPTTSGVTDTSKQNLAQTCGMTNVSRVEIVEQIHRSATPTTMIRGWINPATATNATLYLDAAPGAVDHTCKLRVFGS